MFEPPSEDPQQRVHDAVVKGLVAIAANIIRDAKEDTPVITGLLQGSIRFELDADGLRVDVGSFDVEYAGKVEARVRMLQNAFDEHAPNLYKEIHEALNEH